MVCNSYDNEPGGAEKWFLLKMRGPNMCDQLGFLSKANRVLATRPATEERLDSASCEFQDEMIQSLTGCNLTPLNPRMLCRFLHITALVPWDETPLGNTIQCLSRVD